MQAKKPKVSTWKILRMEIYVSVETLVNLASP